MRASTLFSTTAQLTALAEAETPYSHIAVSIDKSFIELEMNNPVKIIIPPPIIRARTVEIEMDTNSVASWWASSLFFCEKYLRSSPQSKYKMQSTFLLIL